ncbi:MAG: nucleotidyltransferase domain-containing protein [Bacillota bacterium]|nr:nucleotidyltransferase domain-containing protein [Bacillota bacterium]
MQDWESFKGEFRRLLKERYGAQRVFLYGSLAWGGFREGSDLDLLVEGFAGPYWPMYLEAERLGAPFEVNMVLAEEAHPSLLEAVRKDGIPL